MRTFCGEGVRLLASPPSRGLAPLPRGPRVNDVAFAHNRTELLNAARRRYAPVIATQARSTFTPNLETR
eukprot:11174029-Lingulodinium_polyedra.AAC.1